MTVLIISGEHKGRVGLWIDIFTYTTFQPIELNGKIVMIEAENLKGVVCQCK